jgi:hypothetical protein
MFTPNGGMNGGIGSRTWKVEPMERTPTQTDLSRVCQAAHGFVSYWDRTEFLTIKNVLRLRHRLELFQDAVKLVPYHAEFFICPADKWESFPAWTSWNKSVYVQFFQLLDAAKQVFDVWPTLYDATGGESVTKHEAANSDELRHAMLQMKFAAESLETISCFEPSDVQREILDALADGNAMTADALEKTLNLGRHTLFGRKKDGVSVGGLNELVRIGWLANGRKHRLKIVGYFRPDKRPDEKAH